MKYPEALQLTSKPLHLAGLCWGHREAPTWLALHGWMDNAASFSRLAPLIAEKLGIRIIALDFSGHGHSGHRPQRSEYSMWSYCHDVLDVMDTLALDQVTLIGHSLGAGVASIIAAINPQRVDHLILIDGLLGRLSSPSRFLRQLEQGLSDQRRTSSSPPHYDSTESAIEVRVRKSILPIDAETVRPIALRNLKGSPDTGYRLRLDRQVTSTKPVSFSEEQAIAILKNIKCPALLVQGHEGIIPSRDPDNTCRQALSDLTQVSLEGGHHLHLEPNSASEVAKAIIDWASSNGLTVPASR